MSPDTDEYWVGAFFMSCAMAHSWLIHGRSDMALVALDDVLERFGKSPLLASDNDLRQKVAEFWPPGEERDDDRDVLRSLRPGDFS